MTTFLNYPNASNSGVPSGITQKTVGTGTGQVSSGTGWSFDGTSVNVTGSNVLLSKLYIPYNVNINGTNGVTMQYCTVNIGGSGSYGVRLYQSKNFTIQDCNITGLDTGTNRMDCGVKDEIEAGQNPSLNTSISRCQFTMCDTGIIIERGLIQGNWLYNFGYASGDHCQAFESTGGDPSGEWLFIVGNRMEVNTPAMTACITLANDFGAQANRYISGNLLAGGNYCIQGGSGSSYGDAKNIIVVGNQFSTELFSTYGYYGPDDYFVADNGSYWKGNTCYETGAIVNA